MNECLKAIQPVFRIVRRDPFGKKSSFDYVFRGRDDGPIQVNRRKGSGLTFSETEKKEIKESVVILTIAFAMALTGGLSAVMNDVRTFLIYEIPFAFVAEMTGFYCMKLLTNGWPFTMDVGQNIGVIEMDCSLPY